MVSNVFRSSMCNVSRLGNNIEMCVLKMILKSIVYIQCPGEMNNKIIGKWSETVSDEDKQVGMQVLELCIERDSLNEWVFDKGEIFDIIKKNCII